MFQCVQMKKSGSKGPASCPTASTGSSKCSSAKSGKQCRHSRSCQLSQCIKWHIKLLVRLQEERRQQIKAKVQVKAEKLLLPGGIKGGKKWRHWLGGTCYGR